MNIPILYIEATNWELGDLDGYTQTDNPAIPGGSTWHDPKEDNEAVLTNAFGQERIDLGHVLGDAENQLAPVRQRLFADIEGVAEQFQFCLDGRGQAGVLLEIVAEKELQGQFA